MLTALALAGLLIAAPEVRAQSDPASADARAKEEFILVGRGELKAKSLLDASAICEFKKFIRGVPGADSSRLLALRFTRDVAVDQLREVIRGLVQGRPGYAPPELEALLRALSPMAKGSTLELRWGSGPAVEVRAQGAGRIEVPAAGAAEVVWSRLGQDTPG